MIKAISLFLAFTLLSSNVRANTYSSYPEGSWGLPPLKLETERDYDRARKVKKNLIWTSLGLAALSAGAFAYSKKLSRKADRIAVVDTNNLIVPSSGPSYYAPIPGAVEKKGKLYDKSSAARQAGVISGLAAAVCVTVVISIQF